LDVLYFQDTAPLRGAVGGVEKALAVNGRPICGPLAGGIAGCHSAPAYRFPSPHRGDKGGVEKALAVNGRPICGPLAGGIAGCHSAPAYRFPPLTPTRDGTDAGQ